MRKTSMEGRKQLKLKIAEAQVKYAIEKGEIKKAIEWAEMEGISPKRFGELVSIVNK